MFLVPCAETINLGLVADGSGVWKMMHEFNGTSVRTDVAVTNGNPIIVPNHFNEDYDTILKFYKPDNTIFNDTCYKLKIMLTVFTNCEDAVVSERVFDVTIETTGDSFTDIRLANEVVMSIALNAQDYNSPFYSKPLSSSTLTSISGGLIFNEDDIVTVTLKH